MKRGAFHWEGAFALEVKIVEMVVRHENWLVEKLILSSL